MEIELRPFQKTDFTEYLSWFQDESLNRWLGPMQEEDEWLAHVLKDKNGSTFGAFSGVNLIAVIGLVYPNKDSNYYGITSIAVNPTLRRQGIGNHVLQKVMERYSLKSDEYWVAYVEKDNLDGQKFFKNNGWTLSSLEQNKMCRFESQRRLKPK